MTGSAHEQISNNHHSYFHKIVCFLKNSLVLCDGYEKLHKETNYDIKISVECPL